ncbi:MAG: recombinase family protein [Bacillota bacterium]
MALTAVIYVRVSTEEQKSRGYSLPEQIKACRSKAQELAKSVTSRPDELGDLTEHVFEDTAPGDILERPALTAMREWVRAYRPDWVICLDPDRLARRLTLQCLIADELERRGTRLVFVQHDIDRTSPEGRAFFQMRGILAELEKAKILERTSRGKRGKLARGGVPHNVQIYGWDFDRASGTYTVNEAERAWVHRIFQWVESERLTPGEVADRLTALGVPPPSSRRRRKRVGRRWYAGTVRFLLQNRAYVGELVLNRGDWRGVQARRQLPVALRRRLAPEDGGGPLRPRPRSPADWVTLPIPPLIEYRLFEAAQEVLAESRRASRAPRLLSRLVVCALCGGSVHYETKRGRPYLICRNRYNGSRNCRLPLWPAEPIEEATWSEVERLLGESPPPSLADEQAELDQLISQKQAARESLLALLRDGAIGESEARVHLATLAEQLEAARERRAAGGRSTSSTYQAGGLPATSRAGLVRRLLDRVELGATGWVLNRREP